MYGLVAELLDVNIYVSSTTTRGAWTAHLANGSKILFPEFEYVNAKRLVLKNWKETELTWNNNFEKKFTCGDGRCFYFAVLGALNTTVLLPPVIIKKFQNSRFTGDDILYDPVASSSDLPIQGDA